MSLDKSFPKPTQGGFDPMKFPTPFPCQPSRPTPSEILARARRRSTQRSPERSPENVPESVLARSLEKVFRPNTPPRLAVACSGGSDSLALLLLCKSWAEQGEQRVDKRSVTALVCDHKQRASSTRECETLKKRLEDDFGLAALVFAPAMPFSSYKGNLQQNMRLFRLRRFVDWCVENEVSCLALGHTRDDQLETYMLQEAGLLRGRGGMRELRRTHAQGFVSSEQEREGGGKDQKEQPAEVFLLRPLLSLSKAELRAWLSDRGVGWLEDPSNASTRYARNRMRPVCARLSQAEQTRLLARCAFLRKEEEALEEAVRAFKRAHATCHAEGYACVDSRAFLALDEHVALKVLANMAHAVGGKGVRTRQVRRVGRAWRACLEDFLHKAEKAKKADRTTDRITDRVANRVMIDKKESAVFSLGRCLLLGRGDVFFATRAALRVEPLLLPLFLESMSQHKVGEGRLWDERLRILAPRRVPAGCAPSFAGWTCQPLTRDGVVLVRRFSRHNVPNHSVPSHSVGRSLETRRKTDDEVLLEQSLARFENLPWRVREMIPSFWHEGALCALPTFGITLEGEKHAPRLSTRRAAELPRLVFVDPDERNLLLPTTRPAEVATLR